eukprot:snap_masked-scaffold_84-processed-gene-0.16-mRNA-1 protein AED:1.00 eAED:1.00 QI:0/0/0/0/1/1/2/0/256
MALSQTFLKRLVRTVQSTSSGGKVDIIAEFDDLRSFQNLVVSQHEYSDYVQFIPKSEMDKQKAGELYHFLNASKHIGLLKKEKYIPRYARHIRRILKEVAAKRNVGEELLELTPKAKKPIYSKGSVHRVIRYTISLEDMNEVLDPRTTILIRSVNIEQTLAEVLVELHFTELYDSIPFDFIYLPKHKQNSRLNCGFLIINFIQVSMARLLCKRLFDLGGSLVQVSYAKIQGLDDLTKRFGAANNQVNDPWLRCNFG